MSATDGLMRGMEVIDTGAPLSVPVGGATLGRIFNVLGEPVDNLGPTGVFSGTDAFSSCLVREPQSSAKRSATLRASTRVKRVENLMLAETVDRFTPATEVVPNSGKSPPQTQESEERHSAAPSSAPLQDIVDNILLSVFSQAPKDSPVAPLRYPGQHAMTAPRHSATLRPAKRFQKIENFNETMLAETVDRSDIPATEDVRKSTSKLPPQTQGSEKHHPAAPPLEPLEAIIAPTGPTSVAATINAGEQTPLGEATVASNIVGGRPEESSNNFTKKDGNLCRTHSVSLSEMADLWDDDSSSHNEVEFLALNSALVTVNGYRVKEELVPILRAILFKHGDIAVNSSLKSIPLRSSFLEMVCSIIQKLQRAEFVHLTPVELNSMLAVVGDLEFVRLDVGWLRQRLNEIVEAMQLVKNCSTLKEAKTKNIQVIEETEKELDALRERVCSTEDKLAAMKAEAINIEETVLGAKAKVRCFHQRSLVDGLL